MIKVQNNYHKKLTFPMVGITIDAHEVKSVPNDIATQLLNNKWIGLIQSDVKGRKNINKQ